MAAEVTSDLLAVGLHDEPRSHMVPCNRWQIIRGVPVQRYTRLQLVILWWGIGQHIGRILPINRFGAPCLLS